MKSGIRGESKTEDQTIYPSGYHAGSKRTALTVKSDPGFISQVADGVDPGTDVFLSVLVHDKAGKEERLMLFFEARHGHKGPGGSVEEKESYVDAAVRELNEETYNLLFHHFGVTPDKLTQLFKENLYVHVKKYSKDAEKVSYEHVGFPLPLQKLINTTSISQDALNAFMEDFNTLSDILSPEYGVLGTATKKLGLNDIQQMKEAVNASQSRIYDKLKKATLTKQYSEAIKADLGKKLAATFENIHSKLDEINTAKDKLPVKASYSDSKEEPAVKDLMKRVNDAIFTHGIGDYTQLTKIAAVRSSELTALVETVAQRADQHRLGQGFPEYIAKAVDINGSQIKMFMSSFIKFVVMCTIPKIAKDFGVKVLDRGLFQSPKAADAMQTMGAFAGGKKRRKGDAATVLSSAAMEEDDMQGVSIAARAAPAAPTRATQKNG